MAFSPEANDYEGDETINMMTATDVLSEGHNLQDCSALINYDLHWNPVRLIQRAGRIDRIGSKADKIYIKNFLPSDEVEQVINIQKILNKRIKEIHEHVGQDDQILSEDERLNDMTIYAIYEVKDMDDIEMTEEDIFSLDEAELIIKNLAYEKPEYLALLKKMQLGLRSAKTGNNYKGTYAFFRSGDFPRLFIRKPDGAIIDNFIDVLKEVRCDPDEQEVSTTDKQLSNYYDDLKDIRSHFKNLLSDETKQIKIEPEIRKTKARIRTLMQNKQNDEIFLENASKIDSVLNQYFPSHYIPLLRKLNKQEEDDEHYFQELVNIYNDEDLGEIVSTEKKEQKSVIEFICGEILI